MIFIPFGPDPPKLDSAFLMGWTTGMCSTASNAA